MDGQRFDTLVKAAGAVRSRRKVFGAMAAAALGGAARGAAAQSRAYDLTCRQRGVKTFCNAFASTVTRCGPQIRTCVCGTLKEGGTLCVREPKGNCPTRRESCSRNRDCLAGAACIRVPDCCPNNPSRGMCVQRCPE